MSTSGVPHARGQGNERFRLPVRGEAVKRGQTIPYDLNGVPMGGDSALLNGQAGTYYLARANHTGTQPSSTISDLQETVQDLVALLLDNGAGIALSYDDPAGTLTISLSADVSHITGLQAALDAKLDDSQAGAFGLTLLGAADSATAGAALGLAALAFKATVNNADWSGADLEITNGGTGASSAAAARSNLGLEIGANVQAYSASLTSLAGAGSVGSLYYYSAANTWAAVVVAANLGFAGGTIGSALGTMATQQANAVAITGGSATFDGGLISISGLAQFIARDNADSGTSAVPWFEFQGADGGRVGLIGKLTSANGNVHLLSDLGDVVMSPGAVAAVTFKTTGQVFNVMPANYADDTAAAAGGVGVGGVYRNGSVLMVRTV